VVVSPGEYPTVSITLLGHKVADGVETLDLVMPKGGARKRRKGASAGAASSAPAAGAPIADGPVDEGVLARLRSFRHEEARREALPAYCILSNKTLEAIARRRPLDLGALAVLPGIGPAKLEKYGRAILERVRG
jgi:superfamily II DNA helicase RecQ